MMNWKTRLLWLPRVAMMEILLVALCVALALTAPHFLTLSNAFNILRSIALYGVIAFGMTMVIISGEIDLSVGSAVAFSACLTAWLVKAGWPIPLAVAAALAAGFAIGAFSGALRAFFQVPTFITTLALLTGLRGGAQSLTGGFPLTPFPQWYNFLGSRYVFGVPFPAIVLIVVFLLIHGLMNYTSFGRAVYAVGANAEAARLSGIRVGRVKILTMAITGMLAALSGVMYSAYIMSGTPTIAVGLELEVIAAVIIGGTSLMGGAGKVWGTLVGLVFIGVIVNGMTLLNIGIYAQNIVKGVLILVAVLINRLQQGR